MMMDWVEWSVNKMWREGYFVLVSLVFWGMEMRGEGGEGDGDGDFEGDGNGDGVGVGVGREMGMEMEMMEEMCSRVGGLAG